jgi:hypothetical protein
MQVRRATMTLGPSCANSSRITSTFAAWLRGVGSMIRKCSSEMPVPMHVNGETPRSQGLTIVRWVYPLPLEERQIVTVNGAGRTR